MRKMFKRNKSEAGFSLTEIVIYIALVAVAIAGIMAMRENVVAQGKINGLARATAVAADGIARLYNGNYTTGDITADVAGSGVIKEPMRVVGTAIKDDADENVVFTGDTNKFTIEFTTGNPQRCKDLVSGLLNASKKVLVGANVVKDSIDGDGSVDVAKIGTGCDAASASSKATITFTFM